MADLITLAQYKTFKGILSNTQDTKISAIIPAVSSFIENYCDTKFLDYASSPGYTEYFDANQSFVVLKYYPLISVNSVEVSTDGGVTYTALTENDPYKAGYFVDLENGAVVTQVDGISFLASYDTPFKSLKINYFGGYLTETDLPADLKLACYGLVEYYLESQYVPAKALAGATIDNAIVITGADLPPHIRRILDLYRIGI